MPQQPNDFNLLPAFFVCALPLLIGAVSGWVMRGRYQSLGLPWAIIPFGGAIKKFVEERLWK